MVRVKEELYLRSCVCGFGFLKCLNLLVLYQIPYSYPMKTWRVERRILWHMTRVSTLLSHFQLQRHPKNICHASLAQQFRVWLRGVSAPRLTSSLNSFSYQLSFIHISILSFNKYLTSNNYIPGTILMLGIDSWVKWIINIYIHQTILENGKFWAYTHTFLRILG